MKKPFTLVEVLIAMSVLSVFLLGLMQFYSSTETVLSSGLEKTEMFERARIAMDRMQRVKRSAMPCSRRARAARFSIRIIMFCLCRIIMHLLLPGQSSGFGCPRSMTTIRRNSRLFAFLRMASFAEELALMRRSVLLSISSMRITTSAGRILWFSP